MQQYIYFARWLFFLSWGGVGGTTARLVKFIREITLIQRGAEDDAAEVLPCSYAWLSVDGSVWPCDEDGNNAERAESATWVPNVPPGLELTRDFFGR